MWTKVENKLDYFKNIDFKIWDVQFHPNTGRFRYKKKTDPLWNYTNSKEQVRVLLTM